MPFGTRIIPALRSSAFVASADEVHRARARGSMARDVEAPVVARAYAAHTFDIPRVVPEYVRPLSDDIRVFEQCF